MDFFTSDTHFCHDNIIEYCKRPFRDVDEMDEVLIAKWNNKVGPSDTVYHLGDFAFGRRATKERLEQIARRLNGKIRLIRGNHERPAEEFIEDRFEWIEEYHEYYHQWDGGGRIVLFHYPLRTWHHVYRGVGHLYGHVHGGLAGYGKSFDIGVDCWNFEPLSLKEVVDNLRRLETRVAEQGFKGLAKTW